MAENSETTYSREDIFQAAGVGRLPELLKDLPANHEIHGLLPRTDGAFSREEAIKHLALFEELAPTTREFIYFYNITGLDTPEQKPGKSEEATKWVDLLVSELKKKRVVQFQPDESKTVVGSTFYEKLAIGTMFTLAGIGVCTAVVTAAALSELVAPALLMAKTIATAYAVAKTAPYIITRRPKNMSKATQLKLSMLEEDIAAMSTQGGGRKIKPPQVRVWRYIPVISSSIPAAAMQGWRRNVVIFNEQYLQSTPYFKVRGVAAHEVAHIKLRHLHKRFLLFFGIGAAVKVLGLTGWLSVFALSHLSRRFEFQADRVGAVLSRDSVALKKALEEMGTDMTVGGDFYKFMERLKRWSDRAHKWIDRLHERLDAREKKREEQEAEKARRPSRFKTPAAFSKGMKYAAYFSRTTSRRLGLREAGQFVRSVRFEVSRKFIDPVKRDFKYAAFLSRTASRKLGLRTVRRFMAKNTWRYLKTGLKYTFRGSFLPVRVAMRFVIKQHPHELRRYHRLEAINQPERPLANLQHDIRMIPKMF